MTRPSNLLLGSAAGRKEYDQKLETLRTRVTDQVRELMSAAFGHRFQHKLHFRRTIFIVDEIELPLDIAEWGSFKSVVAVNFRGVQARTSPAKGDAINLTRVIEAVAAYVEMLRVSREAGARDKKKSKLSERIIDGAGISLQTNDSYTENENGRAALTVTVLSNGCIRVSGTFDPADGTPTGGRFDAENLRQLMRAIRSANAGELADVTIRKTPPEPKPS